jgi:cell division septum initiation protein DivIVA
MSQKTISRRGALSLLGITAAFGFAVPTTALTTSSARAQTQAEPTAPPPQAQPSGPTPTTPAMSGMERRQQRRAARQSAREMRREARRTAREMRREARQTAREMRREARQTSRHLRREARRGNGQLYMNAGGTTKQK